VSNIELASRQLVRCAADPLHPESIVSPTPDLLLSSRRVYWQWRVLIALMGCYLLYYTGRLAIGHAMPLMQQDLGYSKQQLGWLTAAALASYGIGQAINGNLGDWLGGRLMVTLGALGSMLLCWAFSFMNTALWLAIFWAANGFVQSMGWAPGGRLISVWWPRERRGLAFGLYMLSAGLSTVLVWCTSDLVLALFDPHDPSRWRWLFRLPLVALGVAGLLFYALVRDRPEDVGLPALVNAEPEERTAASLSDNAEADAMQPRWHQRYIAVMSSPGFLLAATVILFQSFARYGLLTWTAVYYSDSGLSVNDALKFTLSLPIGMGIGAVAGGYISDRWFVSKRAYVVAIFLAASAGCFLVLRANPVEAAGDQRLGIGLLFIAGLFVYGAQGPLWAICPDLVGRENSGTAVGLMDALAYAGAALQGPLLGYLIGHERGYGYPALFLVLALVTGTGAMLAMASTAVGSASRLIARRTES
jgi:OPA family glycerol-3-phosphate transporter-like MFS transporter